MGYRQTKIRHHMIGYLTRIFTVWLLNVILNYEKMENTTKTHKFENELVQSIRVGKYILL